MNEAVVSLDPSKILHRISPYLHGHFIEHLGSCIYDGIWVGRGSPVATETGLRTYVVEALGELRVPVLRWPGGCFADQYHWREGVGPAEQRPSRRNVHWKQVENNAFGTEEFMDLCRRLPTEPYLVVNVGSGTVREAADWLEYCNSTEATDLTRLREQCGSPQPHNVRFWGVGNEPWGCGGNMTPEFYGDWFAQYAAFLRATDPHLRLVLAGSHRDLDWDHRLLAHLGKRTRLADYLAVHSYSGRGLWDRDGTPAKLLRLWRDLATTERFLRQALGLLESQAGGRGRIGLVLDEWGTGYEEARVDNGLAMANTLADALFAAASLHLFHELGDGFFMANLAQTVNVLQCLILTDGEVAAKTPTYHAFQLLRPHQGTQRIAFEIDGPKVQLTVGEIDQLSASLSRNDEGGVWASFVNRSPTEPLEVRLVDSAGESIPVAALEILHAQSLAAENLPRRPAQVSPRKIHDGAPHPSLSMPPASIMAGSVVAD